MNEWLIAVLSIWAMLLLTAWLFRSPEKIIERVIEQPKLPPIDVSILQPKLIHESDILLFRVKSTENLSATELLAIKQATEQFLVQHGIRNEVLYLNNCEFETARSLMV